MNFSNLVFAPAIWDHIPRRREHAVLPAQVVQCPLPAGNVEYGFRQGTLPPVRKSW